MPDRLRMAARMTSALVPMLGVSSLVGLTLGPRGWYDPDPATLPAFLGQDVVTLILALPALLLARRHAMDGSNRALLCWMGLLFYLAYSYYFYVIGARISALFPIYIATVSISMYGALAIWSVLDAERLSAMVRASLPARSAGAFFIATSVFFGVLWMITIGRLLAAGVQPTLVTRSVIAVDGVVLLPLLFAGGLWLWRAEPLGIALGGLLLPKVTATFLTLIVSSTFVSSAGHPIDPVQTLAFGLGFVCAAVLFVRFFRSIGSGGSSCIPAHS